jgi:dihydrofolate reductase
MNQIPKAVFSKKGAAILPDKTDAAASGQPQPGADSWGKAHVASGDLAEEIARLKADDGKPIIAHGGATFARSLIAHDLVDQYMLMVYPLALGRGLPIFSDLAEPRRLQLVSSRVFPKGAIAQVYRRG